MPELRIPEQNLVIQAPAATELREVCEMESTDILFGCFSARCGACRIRVTENPEGLSKATEMESELLSQLSAAPDERLACQCSLVGDVTIEIVRQK